MWTHCMIHNQALASKHWSPKFENKSLYLVINVVNYITVDLRKQGCLLCYARRQVKNTLF
jgi:hypothetical protein